MNATQRRQTVGLVCPERGCVGQTSDSDRNEGRLAARERYCEGMEAGVYQ